MIKMSPLQTCLYRPGVFEEVHLPVLEFLDARSLVDGGASGGDLVIEGPRTETLGC